MGLSSLRASVLHVLCLAVVFTCCLAQDVFMEAEVGVDGQLDVEHVSSRLARLQARQAKIKPANAVKRKSNVYTEIKRASADTTAETSTLSPSDTDITESVDAPETVTDDNIPNPEEDTTKNSTDNDDISPSAPVEPKALLSDVALMHALDSTAHNLPTPVGKRVALGWNSNVDLIVNGCDIVRRDFPSATPRDVQMITSLQDFADSFAFWFEKGAAAERFVESAEVFKEIVSLAQDLSQRVEYKTGGNAALMASALADKSCQCDVLLGGLVGPQLQSLLLPSIRTVPSSSSEGPGEDAIHLIMEYSQGETWGGITSPRHNRFIVVHDEYNANIQGLESLAEQVEAESMHSPFGVFIASGLNQMEGLDHDTRDIRLEAVASRLSNINAATPVHLELASMADRDFLLHMFSTLVGHSDSVGLNEEELAMLYEVLGGTFAESEELISSHAFTRDMMTGKVPSPRAIGLALQYVLDAVDAMHAKEPGLRHLSRIHFHCLSFHIISVRQGSEQLWASRVNSSVARGAIAAVAKACATPVEELLGKDINVLAPMTFSTPSGEEGQITEESPVAVWTAGGHSFHLAPVPICRHPKNTVGLGDAISSNALAYSLN